MRYDREFYRERLEFEMDNFLQTRGYHNRNISSVQNHFFYEIFRARNYQKMHHDICKWMFDRAEHDEELWIRIDEQDYTISSENMDEERPYYRVSILTQTMLDYDRMMLNLIAAENSDDDSGENGYATNMYKPFFFNFLIDIKDNPHSVEFFTNPENINQWFYGRFSEKNSGLSGYIERIASPAEYIDKKGIVISDKRLPPSVIHNINEVYDLGHKPCSSDAVIQMELVRILEKPKLSKARIYNVGNANCIYLKGLNSFGDIKILYDIGYHHKVPQKIITNKTYQPSITAIRSLRPQCVIISHWDSDHYYGCAYADPAVFQCKWIAPDLGDNATVSARRVARYLQVMKKIILVDRSSGRQIACIHGFLSELNLYLGEKKRGKDVGIKPQNKEGIILEYINVFPRFTRTFMAGDVPYESIPSIANFSSNTPYDYLVVPHHGAKMNTNRLISTAKKDGYAIICANPDRKIEPHKNALKGNGYSVEVTGNAKLCIDIDLLNKRKPNKR